MSWFIATLLVIFFFAGGTWGWWKGTRDLDSPPDRNDVPFGMRRREFARRLHKRYRRRRLVLTVGGAVGAVAGGFALLLVAAQFRWSMDKPRRR
jgi:hypothetical protein